MRKLWARFMAAREGHRAILSTRESDLTEFQAHARARLIDRGVFK